VFHGAKPAAAALTDFSTVDSDPSIRLVWHALATKDDTPSSHLPGFTSF